MCRGAVMLNDEWGGVSAMSSAANFRQKTLYLDTKNGCFTVRSFCTPRQIEKLSFITPPVHGSSPPLVVDKEKLIKTASRKDVNVTLAFREDGVIAGLGILEYPAPQDRWNLVGDRVMMEVSIIEVRRPWRGNGLAQNILHLTVDHPTAENRIFYMVGYSWTWDLNGNNDTAMEYRNALIQLFSGEGFNIFQTNEPNVMLRPENLFMARIGSAVSSEMVYRFKLTRFNLLKAA